MLRFCNYFNVSVLKYDVAISVKDGREKLREMFVKNKYVTDVRAIDLLVIKVCAALHAHNQLS